MVGVNMKRKNNPLKFKEGFFQSLSKVKLKPSEYDCLMILLEGVELTTTQIKECLGISIEVSSRALVKLNKIGIISVSKVVGRNKYYKVNPQFYIDCDYDVNQLTLD